MREGERARARESVCERKKDSARERERESGSEREKAREREHLRVNAQELLPLRQCHEEAVAGAGLDGVPGPQRVRE